MSSSKPINFCTSDDAETIRAAAALEGQSVSDFVRQAVEERPYEAYLSSDTCEWKTS